MQIKHAVLTSVDRDDLKEDMGSKFWVATIKKIRELNPGITLEALIPDFQGIHLPGFSRHLYHTEWGQTRTFAY